MLRPIVHLGYHKTATTWFQRSFYPRVRNFAYVPRDRVHLALLAPSAFHFDARTCLAQLELSSELPSILCEEKLSGSPLTGAFRGFQSLIAVDRLRATLPDARIVIFVRSQPEVVAASYLQYLRSGGTHSPRRLLFPQSAQRARVKTPRYEARFSFDHFEYEGLIRYCAESFGRERVHVYAYEDFRRDAPRFLASFCRDLGLDVDLAAIPNERRNVSYGPWVSRIARVLNRFTAHDVLDKRHWIHVPGFYAPRRRLLEALNSSRLFAGRADPERVLGRELVAWIRWRYAESNQRLADWLNVDLRALGWTLDPPTTPPPLPTAGIATWWRSR